MWNGQWNKNWHEKPKYSENSCFNTTLSTTNTTCPDLELNLGCNSKKSVTNCLSYSMAHHDNHSDNHGSYGNCRSDSNESNYNNELLNCKKFVYCQMWNVLMRWICCTGAKHTCGNRVWIAPFLSCMISKWAIRSFGMLTEFTARNSASWCWKNSWTNKSYL